MSGELEATNACHALRDAHAEYNRTYNELPPLRGGEGDPRMVKILAASAELRASERERDEAKLRLAEAEGVHPV